MKAQLGNLMQQAQRMQDGMQRAQEEIAGLEISGQSGGGLVSISMNGKHEVRRVAIDPSLLGGDAETLEDLLAAAFNDAVLRLAQESQSRLGAVTAGMNLPAGFKLPF